MSIEDQRRHKGIAGRTKQGTYRRAFRGLVLAGLACLGLSAPSGAALAAANASTGADNTTIIQMAITDARNGSCRRAEVAHQTYLDAEPTPSVAGHYWNALYYASQLICHYRMEAARGPTLTADPVYTSKLRTARSAYRADCESQVSQPFCARGYRERVAKIPDEIQTQRERDERAAISRKDKLEGTVMLFGIIAIVVCVVALFS